MIRRRAAGFTLIELLVVIVIIAILLGILIPVISKVRQGAYNAKSMALIQTLDGAIRQYQMDYKAFPGPIANDQMGLLLPLAPPNNLAIAGGAPGLNAVVETDLPGGYDVIVLANLDPPAAEWMGREIQAKIR